MSYILDALRKAEAERERGHVPGIHAQPVPTGVQPIGAPPESRRWLALGLGGLAVLLLGAGLAWLLVRSSAPAPMVALAPGAPAAAPVPAAPTALASSPTVAAPAAIAAPAATAATPPAITAKPTTSASPPPAAQHKPRPAAPEPRPQAAKTNAPAAVAPQSAQSPQLPQTGAEPSAGGPMAGKIYPLNELPDDIRRQLPPLTVGGSMYSPTPANRLLIVNGQVAHEGDTIAPGLVLEQVRVKTAVLSFRGYRYAQPF